MAWLTAAQTSAEVLANWSRQGEAGGALLQVASLRHASCCFGRHADEDLPCGILFPFSWSGMRHGLGRVLVEQRRPGRRCRGRYRCRYRYRRRDRCRYRRRDRFRNGRGDRYRYRRRDRCRELSLVAACDRWGVRRECAAGMQLRRRVLRYRQGMSMRQRGLELCRRSRWGLRRGSLPLPIGRRIGSDVHGRRIGLQRYHRERLRYRHRIELLVLLHRGPLAVRRARCLRGEMRCGPRLNRRACCTGAIRR
jgi:hypothetical protein